MNIFCQKLVIEWEAEMACKLCGVILSDFIAVVNSSLRDMSDTFSPVELRMAVHLYAIHLIIVDVLKEPTLLR